MIRRHVIINTAVSTALLLNCSYAADDTALFGAMKPADYLTGRFDPAKNRQFVCVNDTGVPVNEWRHYLRREAAAALKKMYADFRKENPKAPFWVQSSTRSFTDQKAIWDTKWKKLQAGGERDPLKTALAILKYSSMPGTSRHHWGTDFDLNVLRNDYFESGEGKVLYRWLTRNADRYGFCQPYTAGRNGGYSEEKWHWSYRPLSSGLLARWNDLYRNDPAAFSRRGLFSGSESSGEPRP